jgi:DNA-binding NtrC family response regulator
MSGAQIKTVLVVDDDRFYREILRERLGGKYLVLTAEDPEEALSIMRIHLVDLIVTDLAMPKINGIEFLSEVRAAGNNCPAILVSGFVNDEERAKAAALNVFSILEKPYATKSLEDTISTALAMTTRRNP